ncbi:hypothetical protein [Arsenicicoccus sp. oral taxon 190]|uniref:hypothetical protein n=1 Tax=Arsenicicoccus sp. oral taxon 190 TaxID=1658671 RepID=UPI00067DB6C0|nr:hypothetical protein [Arsenicicoccus sp. oral taxon 190]
MARIVVNVMPSADGPDAEGHAALPRAAELGFAEFTRIRQGRRYVLSVPGVVTAAHLARAGELGAQLSPEGFEVTGVHPEGASIVVGDHDDDWDAYEDGIGAIAPIPEGAGRREGRTTTHHDVELDHGVEEFGTGVYSGEDD